VDRVAKKNWIDGLSQTLRDAEVVLVAHYSGLDVAEMTELRRSARDVGARFTVTKNRLTRRALAGTRYDALSEFFTGPTAIAFSTDVTSAPKAIAAYARKNDKLIIIGGAMGEALLSADGVKALAAMPSLDELRGRLVGALKAPATKLAAVLQAPSGQLARVLAAYSAKNKDD